MTKNLMLWICGALAIFAVLSGGGGMCLSLLHMSCAEMNEIIVGGACFIAGAVLVGSGTVALAVLSLAMMQVRRDSTPLALDSES